MRRISVAVVLSALALNATPLFAADQDAPGIPTIQITQPQESRPRALPALYVGLSALQIYDGYSTLRGARHGASETNPLVGGLATQPVAFWTVKAISTAASIFLAEQLWREHHRTKAVVIMIIADGVMAAVAARNASIVGSQR
jgi:hypothetical protein